MPHDDRRRVLNLLAEGKITPGEAERLLDTLNRRDSHVSESEVSVDDKIEQAVATTVQTAVSTAKSILSATANGAYASAGEMSDPSNSEIREDSFRAQEVPDLVVENFNGRVEIVGDSPDGGVHITGSIRHPDLVDYSAVQEGDTILVRAKPSGRRSFMGWRFLNRGAHIRISSPSEANVDIQSSNGRVVLRRIEGAGTLRTSNGRIETDRVSGKFDMRTSNSRIEAARVEGDFRLETSNGRITVLDAQGTFDAETSNGSIRFNGEILPHKESRLATSNGSVNATLRGEPSLRVSARTSNGSVVCHREIEIEGEAKKRQLEGVIGGGEGSLTIRTSNGSVTIE